MTQLAIDFAPGSAVPHSSGVARTPSRQPEALSVASNSDAPGRLKRTTIEERFAKFHSENPHVYMELRVAALGAASRGAKRLSIAKLAEDLRADPRLRTYADDFKINNSYRRPYAELLMKREPELAG